MYAIDINRNIDNDIENEFAELVEPVAVRAPRPRCADGHGTLTHLFFSDTPLTSPVRRPSAASAHLPQIASAARSSELSPGECGVASSSRTVGSWSTNDHAADHPRTPARWR